MSEEYSNLRIHDLVVHNFKKIVNVHLVPHNRGVTRVIGKNEAGKSSILDVLWAVIAGPKSFNPTMPIRKGQKSAEAVVNMGDLIAKRKWWISGVNNEVETELILTAADGSPIKRPQEVLNRYFTQSLSDPLSFERAKPADRLAILAKIANVDIAAFTRRRESLFAKRADVNRDIKRVEVEIGNMPPHDDTVPTEEVKIEAILNQIDAAEAENKKIVILRQSAQESANAVVTAKSNLIKLEVEPARLLDELNREVDRLQAMIDEAKAKYEVEHAKAHNILLAEKKALAELEAKSATANFAADESKLIDTEPMKQRIRRAEVTNAAIRQQVARRAKAAEGNELLAKKADLEKQMEAIDEEKLKAVAGAKLPIDGLSLGDEDVLMNKIPFEQCSSAQKLELSATIGLEQNKLKLILIREGSLLDSDRMLQLEQIAERYDGQIFIERVADDDDTKEVGIRIREGYTDAEYQEAKKKKEEAAVAGLSA